MSSHMSDALVAQLKPVGAIDQRFCSPQLLQLREKPLDKSLGLTTGRTFVDALNGATCFQTKSQLLSSRMLLLDGTQTSIASYKHISHKPETSVRAGSSFMGGTTFEIFAQYFRRDGTTVRVVFKNVMSGVECELGFSGDWGMRDGGFWLDRGRKGTRELVAKVYCPEGVKRTSYHIDIAPNMDAALVVLVCAVLIDRQSQDQRLEWPVLNAAAGLAITTNTS